MTIEKSQVIELSNLSELIRLIISNSAQRGGFLYLGVKDGKNIFYISHVVPSWYELKGLPVVITAESDTYPEESFIAYSKPNSTEAESWKFVSKVKENSTSEIYIPIIKVKNIPEFTL